MPLCILLCIHNTCLLYTSLRKSPCFIAALVVLAFWVTVCHDTGSCLNVKMCIRDRVLGVLGNKLAMVSRRTGAVTVVGYLKARYKSDALVIITNLLMVAFFMAQMIGQFTGGATLISSITGLNHVVSLLIFGAVVIIYTSFGGFSAVAITDTIQGIVMCIGTFLFIFFVLKAGGGLSGIDAGLARNLPGVDVYKRQTIRYRSLSSI